MASRKSHQKKIDTRLGFIDRDLKILEAYVTQMRDEFDVQWVRVRVNKPGAIRGSRDVGVIIERGEATN